jgi:hypothetical protein
MGQNDTYGLSHALRATAAIEAAYRTTEKSVAADSIRLMGWNMDSKPDRKVRADKRVTRSAREMQEQRWTNPWNASFGIVPVDQTTETNPMGGDVVAAAMGAGAAGTNQWLHTLTDGQALPTLTWNVEAASSMQELLTSAWVDQLTINLPQTDDPSFEASGGAVHGFITGTTTVNGGTGPLASFVAQAADIYSFDGAQTPNRGGIIEIVGVATDLLVIDRNTTTNVVSLDTTVTTTGAEVVQPWTPFDETIATMIAPKATAMNVTCDWEGETDILFQSAAIEINNNMSEILAPGRNYTADFNPLRRTVTGNIKVWARKTDMRRFLRTRVLNVTDINPLASSGLTFDVTTSAGALEIAIPRPVIDPAAISWPDEDAGEITLPFTALTSTITASADEIALTWS